MMNHLYQLMRDETISVDVVLSSCETLDRCEVLEADAVGLLTLRQGCKQFIPWTAVAYVRVNCTSQEETEENVT